MQSLWFIGYLLDDVSHCWPHSQAYRNGRLLDRVKTGPGRGKMRGTREAHPGNEQEEKKDKKYPVPGRLSLPGFTGNHKKKTQVGYTRNTKWALERALNPAFVHACCRCLRRFHT
jgi:hypothetical protein